VGPRAGLDARARRKILCPCRGSNLDRPARNQTLHCLSYLSYRGSAAEVDPYQMRRHWDIASAVSSHDKSLTAGYVACVGEIIKLTSSKFDRKTLTEETTWKT
jgi:hypothetical protein